MSNSSPACLVCHSSKLTRSCLVEDKSRNEYLPGDLDKLECRSCKFSWLESCDPSIDLTYTKYTINAGSGFEISSPPTTITIGCGNCPQLKLENDIYKKMINILIEELRPFMHPENFKSPKSDIFDHYYDEATTRVECQRLGENVT